MRFFNRCPHPIVRVGSLRRLRHKFAAGVALLLAAAAANGPQQTASAADSPQRPNIVFILADDLGYTDLGCYGSKYHETPHLDRMAAEGLRFTNGYTCGPNCQPTRAALLSGQYGPRTGVYTVGGIDRFNWRSQTLRPVDNVTQLPRDKVTIADALRSAGYATGMFGKWHLGEQDGHHPSKRGFDEAISSSGRHFKFETRPKTDYPEGTYLADFLTGEAVDFIRRHKDRPFFLYLPHFGVHSPYQAKAELIAKFKDKPAAGGHHDPVYAAMLASVDESVGRVLATLDELQLSKNTLVIFSSDNGGVGGYAREGINKKNPGVTDNAPLRGGKGMLYEGGIRVPYIFRWPGRIEAGTTSDEPIISVDLYPTLLELAAAERPEGQPLDGVSYFALLTERSKGRDRPPLYWHFPGYLGAGEGSWRTKPVGVIRSGDWKLMEFFEDGRLELYNVATDVGESQNLAEQHPEKAKQLHARLIAWRESVNAPLPSLNDPLTVNDPPAKKKKKKGRKGDEAL